MRDETIAFLQAAYGVNPRAIEQVEAAECDIAHRFAQIEEVALYNQAKVLRALQAEPVALRHFAPTSGYGYDDVGRDALDRVFARAFDTEDALVRPHFASGTHALVQTLTGVLTPGDQLLVATGKPYDTLEEALGLSGDAWGSLKHLGIAYAQVELREGGQLDSEAIAAAVTAQTKVVYFQRSRGYTWRSALDVAAIGRGIAAARAVKPDIVAIVDNCYGEFTELREPCAVGADLIVGSLIKNPGGGIAPTGAYVAGGKRWVDRVASRLFAPGIGREVGSYAASYTPFFQGLFLAPQTTAASLKGAVLAARVFENRGLATLPASGDARSDIIQAIRFDDRQRMLQFCRSIQRAAPVDSHLTPEPWDMPGYQDPVVMAAGSFVQGASIELSADGPVKPPYIAYMQGGLCYDHVKIALILALSDMETGNALF